MRWFDGAAAPGWFDWLGLAITLAGFGVAIWQLRKTTSAANAAAGELARARERLNGDQLAAVVPQMQSVVSDLEHAMASSSQDVAVRALARFKLVAGDANALLTNLNSDYSELQARLDSSAKAALRSQGALASRSDADLPRLVKKVSSDIEALAGDISAVVAAQRYSLRGAQDV